MLGEATLRWVRASVLAALTVLSGLAGHVAAGGSSPSASTVVVMLVLASVLLAPMVGEPASTGRVVALLVGGQGLVHLALQWLGPVLSVPAAGPGMPMPNAAAMDAMAGGLMTSASMTHGPAAAGTSSLALMGGSHLLMVLGHLAAAVLVGVWLAAGERAVWTLLALAGSSVLEVVVAVLRRATGVLPACHTEPSGLTSSPGWFWLQPLGRLARDAHALCRRGPPVAVVA
jgi:hypothetical protein